MRGATGTSGRESGLTGSSCSLSAGGAAGRTLLTGGLCFASIAAAGCESSSRPGAVR